MDRTIGWLSVLAFAGFGSVGGAQLGRLSPFQDNALRLKEEAMIVEYSPARNEAVLVVEAESETSLGQVEVLGPHGERVFQLQAGDRPLQGFVIETHESTPQALFKRYTRGTYELRARTVDGRSVVGSAVLSHQLLAAPALVLPTPGSSVPTNTVVSWAPDPDAAQYTVTVEQDENDGLSVTLPPGTSTFQIPFGVLRPATDTHVEVAAVGSDGNRTQSEVEFRTL